jgi:hypothetical protein
MRHRQPGWRTFGLSGQDAIADGLDPGVRKRLPCCTNGKINTRPQKPTVETVSHLGLTERTTVPIWGKWVKVQHRITRRASPETSERPEPWNHRFLHPRMFSSIITMTMTPPIRVVFVPRERQEAEDRVGRWNGDGDGQNVIDQQRKPIPSPPRATAAWWREIPTAAVGKARRSGNSWPQ